HLSRRDDRGVAPPSAARARERSLDATNDDRRPAARAQSREPRNALARAAARTRTHGRKGRAGDPLSQPPRLRDRRAVPRLRVRGELSSLRYPVRVSHRWHAGVPPLWTARNTTRPMPEV